MYFFFNLLLFYHTGSSLPCVVSSCSKHWLFIAVTSLVEHGL